MKQADRLEEKKKVEGEVQREEMRRYVTTHYEYY